MFHVDSEVGVLRQVILHRPDLELKRLTPDNAADLLFDDVLWVAEAQAEHDAFAAALRRARDRRALLRRAVRADPRGRRGPGLRAGPGLRPAAARAAGGGRAAPGDGRARPGADAGAVPDRRHHQARDPGAGPGAEEHRLPLAGPGRLRAVPAAEPALPAGHLLLDLRRGVGERHAAAGPDAGDGQRRGHVPVASDVRRGRVRDLAARRGRRARHDRGRRHPGARRGRGPGRDERADPAAGGGDARRTGCSPRRRPTGWWRSTCRSRGRSCTWTRC